MQHLGKICNNYVDTTNMLWYHHSKQICLHHPAGDTEKGKGKMNKYVHKSPYFYGNKISDYGLENGYVDYATLAKAFDAVLVNDITKLFFADINGEFNEPEQVNGFIDNQSEIDELNDRISELMLENDDDSKTAEIDELQERIDELEQEQDNNPEIFQYFIISDNGAEILQELTDEIVYYLPVIDCYVWGVTHWGTGWDYVLTDIPIEIEQ